MTCCSSDCCCGCSSYCNHPFCHGRGPFFGRLLIGIVFVIAAFNQIFNFNDSVAYLEEMGVVAGSNVYLVIGILLGLIGGILLILGLYTRLACWLLMIYLVPTTFIFHRFWEMSGTAALLNATIFGKDVAVFGGLLLLCSYGPGHWSLDAKKKYRCGDLAHKTCCSIDKSCDHTK